MTSGSHGARSLSSSRADTLSTSGNQTLKNTANVCHMSSSVNAKGPRIYTSNITVANFSQVVGIQNKKNLSDNTLNFHPSLSFVYSDVKGKSITRMCENNSILIQGDNERSLNSLQNSAHRCQSGAQSLFDKPPKVPFARENFDINGPVCSPNTCIERKQQENYGNDCRQTQRVNTGRTIAQNDYKEKKEVKGIDRRRRIDHRTRTTSPMSWLEGSVVEGYIVHPDAGAILHPSYFEKDHHLCAFRKVCPHHGNCSQIRLQAAARIYIQHKNHVSLREIETLWGVSRSTISRHVLKYVSVRSKMSVENLLN